MDKVIHLFRLIKNHEYDKFGSELSEDEEVDVNMKDSTGNYMIHYAILFNRKDLVTSLINHGARLDVTDTDGRSIIHLTIKYGYQDILELLIHFNRTNIGVSLVDIRDRFGNIPLHYAITFGNISAVESLIKAGSDVNLRDSNGYNSLHLAILQKDIHIVDIILKTNININSRTKSGESSLHLACNHQLIEAVDKLLNKGIDVNIADYENELTALNYAINLHNTDITMLLIKHGANPNIQDYYGNSALHYAIIEDNPEVVMILIQSAMTKDKVEGNLQNIDGSTPLHIALARTSVNTADYISLLLPMTNVNLQDNRGDTPLHLIIEIGEWETFFDELAKKKLYGLIENKDHTRPVDLIKDPKRDKFIKLLVRSYHQTLRTYHNIRWESEWEDLCGKDKLTDDEVKLLQKKTGKQECEAVIENVLRKRLKKKGEISQPRKKVYHDVEIIEGDKVSRCTYTGMSLDIICGVIHLSRKFSSVGTIMTNDFVTNENLVAKYRDQGFQINTLNEFTNFEVVWMNKSINLPSHFDQTVISKYNDPKVRFIIIPIGIHMERGNHANVLLYDKTKNEIERFEPNGSNPPYQFNYNDRMLDYLLKSKLEGLIPDIKYFAPSDYLPKIGFQYLDAYERNRGRIGDPPGFCAVWNVWYVEQRVSNPRVTRDKLVKRIIGKMKRQTISFKNMIRNYSENIVEIRDEILDAVGLEVDDWINGNLTKEHHANVVKGIRNIISKLH